MVKSIRRNKVGLCPPANAGTPRPFTSHRAEGRTRGFFEIIGSLGTKRWHCPTVTTSDQTGTSSRPKLTKAECPEEPKAPDVWGSFWTGMVCPARFELATF